MTFLQGVLIKISPYKQLIIQIDEKQHILAKKWKIATWTYQKPVTDSEDQTIGELHYYARVNLDKYDKLALGKKFEPLVGGNVIINGSIESYTTKDGEFEAKTSYYFLLHNIKLKKATE